MDRVVAGHGDHGWGTVRVRHPDPGGYDRGAARRERHRRGGAGLVLDGVLGKERVT